MSGLKFIYKVGLRPNTLTYWVELGPIRAMAQNTEKTHVIDQVTRKPESVECICSHSRGNSSVMLALICEGGDLLR